MIVECSFCAEHRLDPFSRFDTIPACGGQTDTPGHRLALCMSVTISHIHRAGRARRYCSSRVTNTAGVAAGFLTCTIASSPWRQIRPSDLSRMGLLQKTDSRSGSPCQIGTRRTGTVSAADLMVLFGLAVGRCFPTDERQLSVLHTLTISSRNQPRPDVFPSPDNCPGNNHRRHCLRSWLGLRAVAPLSLAL